MLFQNLPTFGSRLFFLVDKTIRYLLPTSVLQEVLLLKLLLGFLSDFEKEGYLFEYFFLKFIIK